MGIESCWLEEMQRTLDSIFVDRGSKVKQSQNCSSFFESSSAPSNFEQCCYCLWKVGVLCQSTEAIVGCHLAKHQFKRIFAIAKCCWSVFGTVKDSIIRIWLSSDVLWLPKPVVNNWSFIVVHLVVVLVQSFRCRSSRVARHTQAELRAMEWEWCEHPPYSPDLSPLNYHFSSL